MNMTTTGKIKDCKHVFKECAKRSQKKGYVGDSAEYMFRVHVLELLEEIVKETTIKTELLEKLAKKTTRTKRNPSEYNLFMAKEVSKGSSFSDAVDKWNERKK